MNELDQLVMERFVSMKTRAVEHFARQHPHLMAVLQRLLGDRENRVGIRVTENGQVAGDYTLHLQGTTITGGESGVLSPELHHPFGIVIRPYVIVERRVLEQMLQEEDELISHPLSAVKKYLPEVTVRFMRAVL